MLKFIALPLLLALCTAANAATPPLLVVNDTLAKGESTINLRQESAASCAMPSVGDCGSCAVSCQMGEAAICKPGKAAGAEPGASCLREPLCRCESANRPATR